MNICHISTSTGHADHFLQARTGEGQPESDIRPEILNRDGLLLPEGTHCILTRGCSFEGVLGAEFQSGYSTLPLPTVDFNSCSHLIQHERRT